MCIDIARAAMQMHGSGASVADIRKSIETNFGSKALARTPTPMPK
jgi:predicted nucleic acid-binding Zn ribbon protein